MSINKADKNLAAVCGLCCGTCLLYIGTTEEPARLEAFAASLGRDAEELICYGCRADKRSCYCATCEKVACATQKGIAFCSECSEFPCDDLKAFQAEKPHRAELWLSLARISEVGWEKWQQEMYARHTCRKCSTINSAYDLACRGCGGDPSCDFVATHREALSRHLGRV